MFGESAWFIDEQKTVYVGHKSLLVNRKVMPMPSMPLSCGFARLLKGGCAAAKPENQSTQKDCQSQKRCAFGAPDDTQNRPNESVFHCSFLLKFETAACFPAEVILKAPAERKTLKAPAEQEPLNITQPAKTVASEVKTIISVGRRAVNTKSCNAIVVLEQVGGKVFLGCKAGFSRTIW